ncbi:C-type lectin domain family 4 member K [Liparis tanakae]|uniref:C-type lectin domain family 4 member K n=1 Tax=Liparis tanakae TaxID=230148 RepID=A0A4Z2EP34_9TELE|nr:C-type lectin domain family 4 member K [Liparis tanakae]
MLSWSDARDYCRAHHTDLSFIENDRDNDEVYTVTQGHQVWIGLHRVRWTWSDKSLSPFRIWAPKSPNYFEAREHCVGITHLQEWDDFDCTDKMDFICHGVPTLKTMIRMKMKTSADITDPATNAQILQQLSAALTRQGLTDFKLKWKTPPRKQKERPEF